ncbi:ATP-binding protein [Undibacterium flavidum]|uniref:histidine kinase n=1 Tax=Undibacterium flavidum TaxID=2762297 RepID=A0ABR6Y8D7_9BURK|nr:ATP-binding protein [Undibacterium flavidum]MBC3872835.1 PAS domain-containing protein [Undibacterium flavidum]
MESPQIPQNETIRLQALREFDILDTLPEERFDRLTRLAQSIFNTEIALVSLIDADRQWFKSKQGLDACETDRDISFCGHAILEQDIFHIPNASLDLRFADNPLVTGPPNIRFYAGAPLRPDGKNSVGTLCIIDSQPRTLSIKERRTLRDLADCVEQEILQSQMSQQHQALLSLTKISSLVDPNYHILLRKALKIAQDFLDMPNAMINRVRDQDCEILIQSSAENSAEGNLLKLEQTLCSITLARNTLILLPNVQKTAYANLSKDFQIVVNSYIGAPIEVHQNIFGSLVFSSPEPRSPNYFSKVEIEFIQLFSDWVNSKIHEWELDQSLKSQQQLAKAISHAQEKFIHGQDQNKGFNDLLRDILELSVCEFGFIGEILQDQDGQEYVKTFALGSSPSFATEQTQAHLDPIFAKVIPYNVITIANSVSDLQKLNLSLPHASTIQNFLGIPIYYNEKLVALIGLANRPFGFQSDFIKFLDPILLTIGQLVQAARVQVQHAESERRLADIIKGTNIGTWEWNVQSGDINVNQRWAEILGYSLEEIIPVNMKNWHRFAHPDDTKAAHALLQEHFSGALDYYEITSRMRHKDGHWVWILDRGCLISRTSDGLPLLMSGSHADISRQKEAEEQLAHAYDLLEQSNAVARIGTWEIDISKSSMEWSNITKQIFDVETDFVCDLAAAIQFYKVGKDRELISQLLQKAIEDGQAFDTELEIVTKTNKERWVRVVGISQLNGEICERVYGTLQDISERKRIEKMKDEFISTVSHELRTPLTSISGALSLMVNGVMGDIPEKIKSMLHLANKNGQRLSLLINDLLDMEKLSAGQLHFKIESLALAGILQTAVESNSGATIERMISMSIDNPHGDIHILVDQQRLMQVLTNLLSNAIKYSPNHGHIQLTVNRDDGNVRITISDQGPGIPAEFQTRIFQKFAQADSSDTRQRGGTGLGLAISKELVEAMHGQLSFSSTIGHGAHFYLDLPIDTKNQIRN